MVGARRRARWGWYLYDPAYVRDKPDIYAGKPGASYGARFLPGFEETLAEAYTMLGEQSGRQQGDRP